MNFTLIGRFVLCCAVLAAILWFALPFAGISSARILPPNMVYASAKGTVNGRITQKRMEQTNDPFHIGDHLHFIDYYFYAPTPNPKDPAHPGKKQLYYGSVRVERGFYDNVAPDQIVAVKYEKSAPDINGINEEGAGQGYLGASGMLSAWLLWDIGMMIIVYFILARFTRTGDI